MPHEQTGQPETPGKKAKRPVENRIIVVVILLIVAFLAGFLPADAKGRRLERELREARRENRLVQLRDSACLAYLQASRRDYGLAAGTSTLLFARIREAANQTPDPSGRKLLEDLLSVRDQIAAKLANGDPGVVTDLQALLVKTRQATIVPTGAPQPE